MKTLALITTALTFVVLGCSNPYERDNPTDPIFVYKVTFNASDATGGTPPAALSGSWGDVVTLPDGGGLVRSGYAFSSWANTADSKNYPTGFSYTITGNAAMNVTWIPVYTVTFDGNGATNGTVPPSMTADSNSSIQIPAKGNLERTGYHFWGWDNSAYGLGSLKPTSSYTVTRNITLYASWVRTFTITFDGNGATGGTVPESIVSSSVGTTLPTSVDLERSGYIFAGWNTNSSGTGTRYALGSSYISQTNPGDFTLYAEWVLCNPETHSCDMRDGHLYRITTIGEQIWFAENLNYNATGSKCYDNLDSYCDTYGRLYNWTTALTVCPEGWHLPSRAEWNTLIDYVQSDGDCSRCSAVMLKATSGWSNYGGALGNGTDDYGFSALPGGYGNSDGGFNGVLSYGDGMYGMYGQWWSASQNTGNSAYSLRMDYNNESAYLIDYWSRPSLFSVRCLKD